MSLIDDILKADDLPAVPVDVWGITVHVATLRADERDEMETMWGEFRTESGQENNVGFRAFVVAYCLCDEQRSRLFKDFAAFTDAVRKLRMRRASDINLVFSAASRINGLTKSDEEELKKTSKPATTTAGN